MSSSAKNVFVTVFFIPIDIAQPNPKFHRHLLRSIWCLFCFTSRQTLTVWIHFAYGKVLYVEYEEKGDILMKNYISVSFKLLLKIVKENSQWQYLFIVFISSLKCNRHSYSDGILEIWYWIKGEGNYNCCHVIIRAPDGSGYAPLNHVVIKFINCKSCWHPLGTKPKRTYDCQTRGLIKSLSVLYHWAIRLRIVAKQNVQQCSNFTCWHSCVLYSLINQLADVFLASGERGGQQISDSGEDTHLSFYQFHRWF